MALKTLKYGELYLMGDGSRHKLYANTSTTFVSGYVHSGTWNIMHTVTDMFRRTGDHFLSHDYDAANGSAVFNPAQAVQDPLFYSDGTNVHMWYGYDSAGGTAYKVYYSYSTDGGATWAAGVEVVALGLATTWNDVAIVPIGIRVESPTLAHLFVVADDGSSWKVGRYTIIMSGPLTTDFANSANYLPWGDNPITGAIGSRWYSTIFWHDNQYWMYHANDISTATVVYVNSSPDGLKWPANLTSRPVLRRGVNTTNDDDTIRIGGVCVHEGWVYLFYRGGDGSNNNPMIAIGRDPRRMVKVGNVESLAAYARVRFAADLTFDVSPQAVHVHERGRPGVLLDAPFEPFNLSFTFKQDVIGGSDGIKSGASAEAGDNVWQYLMLANPSVREEQGQTMSVPSVNLLYRMNTDVVGTLGEWMLFLDCSPLNVQTNEAAEGNTVTVTYRCHGGNLPLSGRY